MVETNIEKFKDILEKNLKDFNKVRDNSKNKLQYKLKKFEFMSKLIHGTNTNLYYEGGFPVIKLASWYERVYLPGLRNVYNSKLVYGMTIVTRAYFINEIDYQTNNINDFYYILGLSEKHAKS